ncbi:hypothetical protein FQN54_005314 [Arachnomyces sp. PD_36]|nr:hypothetical protein FQN54_005314 [Arachnomyces sp. PD_36]
MAFFLPAIGLISGVLRIVQFGMDNFAGGDTGGAKVRVHAGLGQNSSQSMGGEIHQIYGFNYYGKLLGQSDQDIGVEDGGFADITIHQDEGETVASRYINLISGDDATCIVYIATTQPDGFKRTWLGDVGYSCGQTWYESGYTVGTDQDGNNYQPKCTWIDGNGDPTNTVSMKIDTEFYVVKHGHVDPQMDICGGTTWSDSSEPIPDKRSIKQRPEKHNHVLIVSTLPSSSAEELCAHENSMGPDFVSLRENAFCDMDAKELYPLCDDIITSDCFNLQARAIAHRGSNGRIASYKPSPYKDVVTW